MHLRIRVKTSDEESLAACVSDGNMTHKGGAQTITRLSAIIILRNKLTSFTVAPEINVTLIMCIAFFNC